jgi:EpsI family protein
MVSVGLLAAAFWGLRSLSRAAPTLERNSLEQFPSRMGEWEATEIPIDAETREVLAATDLVNRVYQSNESLYGVGLFMAFFESQRKGGAVHSPKNCLPGSGWAVVETGTTQIATGPHSAPVRINSYVVQKETEKQLILYWYQSQGRVIASEYSAKVFLVWDALRRGRSDGALVRIATALPRGQEAAAQQRAEAFAQQILPLLPKYIPN